MSGHSKWASIKHKKAATDAKRGALFTKLIREITTAARSGGNPETNPRLRTAIARAKSHNMPTANIENAIKKGTGELPGVVYEEITYEGFGPGGVGIMVDVLTDNKNRASAEIRNIFSKKGGNLSGSVAWMFQKKGYIVIDRKIIEEDKLLSFALEAGAEDMKTEESTYAIICDPKDFEKVKKTIEEKKIPLLSAEITMIPTNTIRIEEEALANQILDLVDELENHVDVQHVYANFDIPDEILEKRNS